MFPSYFPHLKGNEGSDVAKCQLSYALKIRVLFASGGHSSGTAHFPAHKETAL